MSLINVGDHEILWGKDSISLDERHFMACCSIQWEKRGICQFPIRSFLFQGLKSSHISLSMHYEVKLVYKIAIFRKLVIWHV